MARERRNMQKTIYIIGGTMGAGKTTVCQILKKKLPDCVFLDGDWCWDMDPFQVTEETKTMVLENVVFLLNRFIRCSAFKNIVFCWVLHEQGIIDGILAKLETENCRVRLFSLLCGEKELARRLRKDVDSGIRAKDVIARSLARIPLYEKLNTVKIDVSRLTPEQAAAEIIRLSG
mgnify:FL=1